MGTDSARCAAEGLTDVNSAISQASNMDFQLDNILSKGKDPDGFKALHAKFLEKVDEAEKALATALVELERREKARAARNEIDERLQSAVGSISACTKKMGMAVMKHEGYEQDLDALDNLRTECNTLQTKGHNIKLEDLTSQADALCAKAETQTAEVEAKVSGAAQANKDKFAKLRGIWGN